MLASSVGDWGGRRGLRGRTNPKQGLNGVVCGQPSSVENPGEWGPE